VSITAAKPTSHACIAFPHISQLEVDKRDLQGRREAAAISCPVSGGHDGARRHPKAAHPEAKHDVHRQTHPKYAHVAQAAGVRGAGTWSLGQHRMHTDSEHAPLTC
jgi:hypothetical protein